MSIIDEIMKEYIEYDKDIKEVLEPEVSSFARDKNRHHIIENYFVIQKHRLFYLLKPENNIIKNGYIFIN
jgi:hypothetical protein